MSSKIRVATIEMRIEPKHPRRLEKKKNMRGGYPAPPSPIKPSDRCHALEETTAQPPGGGEPEAYRRKALDIHLALRRNLLRGLCQSGIISGVGSWVKGPGERNPRRMN